MLKVILNTDILEWLCGELGCEAEEAEGFAGTFISYLRASGGLVSDTDAAECHHFYLSDGWHHEAPEM